MIKNKNNYEELLESKQTQQKNLNDKKSLLIESIQKVLFKNDQQEPSELSEKLLLPIKEEIKSLYNQYTK